MNFSQLYKEVIAIDNRRDEIVESVFNELFRIQAEYDLALVSGNELAMRKHHHEYERGCSVLDLFDLWGSCGVYEIRDLMREDRRKKYSNKSLFERMGRMAYLI